MHKMVILLSLVFVGCSNSNLTECAYITQEAGSHEFDFSPQGVCGTLVDEDTLVLDPNHFKKLAFGRSNLSTIYTDNGVFYVSKEGKVVHSLFFDNGADYFEEGLSRVVKKKDHHRLQLL